MPLLQWLPHSYVGPRQLHRIIIRGTMKSPGHWQLIWLTVQYFHQGNKPCFATEAKVGEEFGGGNVMAAVWNEGRKWNGRELEGPFEENSPCCSLCVLYSCLRFPTEMYGWVYRSRSVHQTVHACQCDFRECGCTLVLYDSYWLLFQL